MNLYQIYWSNGYEGDAGGILSHKKKFTQQEFDDIVKQSRKATGDYQTFLDEIENYMIENFGFKKVPYMSSCT